MSYQIGQQELIDRIKLSPSREWINTYFDLIHQLIVATNLSNEDPRFAMTIPLDTNGGKPYIPVSINLRYVLACDFVENDLLVTFAFVNEYDELPDIRRKTKNRGKFVAHKNETIAETPYWLNMNIFDFACSPEIRMGWLKACFNELGKAKRCKYRKSHKLIVYDAALFPDYRKMLIDKAF